MRTNLSTLLMSGICSALFASGATAQAPASDDARRLAGTWRLVSITESRVQEHRGDKPTGLIYYDEKGNMAVQIMPGRARAKYAGPLPTPDEARDSLLGYSAYFGTYTVDTERGTVTHHRTGNINPGGMGDFVRRYEFLPGDRVILMPLETRAGLVWERIK